MLQEKILQYAEAFLKVLQRQLSHAGSPQQAFIQKKMMLDRLIQCQSCQAIRFAERRDIRLMILDRVFQDDAPAIKKGADTAGAEFNASRLRLPFSGYLQIFDLLLAIGCEFDGLFTQIVKRDLRLRQLVQAEAQRFP